MSAERFEVELTQGAEDDLEAIYDYLAEKRSVDSAQALLQALLERIDTVEQLPHRGNVPIELGSLGVREFRQVLPPPYRLIYRLIAQKVFIMLLADGRRDMQALLERRLLGG